MSPRESVQAPGMAKSPPTCVYSRPKMLFTDFYFMSHSLPPSGLRFLKKPPRFNPLASLNPRLNF